MMPNKQRDTLIDRITLTGEPAVFMATYEGAVTAATGERIRQYWTQAWKDAGVAKPPVLILVDSQVKITALSGADLKALGLMRIPVEG